MKTRCWKHAMVAGVMLCALEAWAGLPEPWMILYGQVRDDAGVLITAGDLTFAFVAQAGGETFSYSVALSETEAPGGPFSYVLRIPLESEVAGYAVSAAVLELPSTSAVYTRTATLAGSAIAMSHEVTLTQADRGSIRRVDVCTACGPMGAGCHSADWDQSFSFSLSELLRVVELFTYTPEHVYHVNAATEDGYAPGLGSLSGMPHSIDYVDFGDWSLSLSEVLRMIDLFASTPNHTYHPDSGSEDGFTTGPLPKGARGVYPEGLDRAAMSGVRLVRGGAVGATPGMLAVSVATTAHAGLDITAFGVEEDLPEGWRYAGLTSKAGPDILPHKEAGARAEFAWLTAPAFPCVLDYAVEFPLEGDVGAAVLAYDGVAQYRVLAGAHGYSAEIAMGRRIGQHDLDGDGVIDDRDGDYAMDDWNNNGIADVFETIEDTDGDGIGDDFDGDGEADDADGDGVADAAEWAGDTDGDGVVDDFDRDGRADDEDNNGIADVLEGIEDRDGDGVPDDYDGDGVADDANNNGIADAEERTMDMDGDGVADWVEGGEDADGDFIPNFLDVDADNDGKPDTLDPVSSAPLFAFLDVRAYGDTVLLPEGFEYRLAVEVAGGMPPYQYHWKVQNAQKQTRDIGPNTAVMRTEGFSLEAEGYYYCVVEDAMGRLAASDGLEMLLKEDLGAPMPVAGGIGLAFIVAIVAVLGAGRMRKK